MPATRNYFMQAYSATFLMTSTSFKLQPILTTRGKNKLAKRIKHEKNTDRIEKYILYVHRLQVTFLYVFSNLVSSLHKNIVLRIF
jgi:hypothetical protein